MPLRKLLRGVCGASDCVLICASKASVLSHMSPTRENSIAASGQGGTSRWFDVTGARRSSSGKPFTSTTWLTAAGTRSSVRQGARQTFGAIEPHLLRPLLRRGYRDRNDFHSARRGQALYRHSQISLLADFRLASGHRDREYAPFPSGAGAHARSLRGAGAADRDLRSAQGDQLFARRAEGGVRDHAGECDAHLSRPISASCHLYDDRTFHLVAMLDAPPEFAEFIGGADPFQPTPALPLAARHGRQSSHCTIADLADSTATSIVAAARIGGA